jgi:hypothetical protein
MSQEIGLLGEADLFGFGNTKAGKRSVTAKVGDKPPPNATEKIEPLAGADPFGFLPAGKATAGERTLTAKVGIKPPPPPEMSQGKIEMLV